MISSILIKGVSIIDPNSKYNKLKKDILIKDGVIIDIKDKIDTDNVEIIKKENLFICPGLFDFSVNFPEPGNEQKETLHSGIQSSISGGFTALGLQPTKEPARDKKSDILFCVNSSNITWSSSSIKYGVSGNDS